MSDHDDFWGDTPDWTSDTPRPRRSFGIAARRQAMVDRLAARRRTSRNEIRDDHDLADRELGGRHHRSDDAHELVHEVDGTRHDTWTAETTRSGDGARTANRSADDRTGDHHAEHHADHHTGDHHTGDQRNADDHVELDVDLDAEPIDARHDRRPGVDPLLARFGAAAVVLTLMVPLAVNLTSNEGIDETVAADGSIAPAAIADADDGGAVLASTQPSTSTETSVDTTTEPTTYLDPADLPPAVPVNDVDDEPDLASPSAATDDEALLESPAARNGAPDTEIRTSADVDDQADRLRVPCPIDFTVRAGDFWIGLADEADVELSALLDVNDADVDTPLYPGAEICLPSGATTPTATAPTTTTEATDDGGTSSDDSATTATTPTTATPTTATPSTATPSTTAATTTTTTATTTTATVPATAPPTSTASTTDTTTDTTTAPVAPAGPDEVTSIIRDVWPDDLEERALEIAFRESRYDPTAKNFCCYGLFQIYWSVHQGWLADLGVTSAEQLYDPETNARAAYELYERSGGWGPWGF